ncbi:MAG: hypothetical protein HY719_12585 [Planctomycetes bacterium]|nr:hypothetical protein [Planctomycetota bacterium]
MIERVQSRATMVAAVVVTVACAAAAWGCAGRARDTSVRATLADEQVFIGDLDTKTIALKTGIGALDLDPADIGEIGPVEGSDLKVSGAAVKVWLRNGSEFAGSWTDPSAAIAVTIGGERQSVPLPIERLKRLQFTGSEVWPEEKVVRVLTTSGDDFLVDAASSRMTLTNDLGSFRPTFDEIAALRPLTAENRQWRVELTSGMVLLGAVEGESLRFRMHLGPREVDVPLIKLKEIRQEFWRYRGEAGGDAAADSLRAEEERGVGAGYFSNRRLQAQKMFSGQAGSSSSWSGDQPSPVDK